MAIGTCDSCGSEEEVTEVRRVYVTPESWDTEGKAEPQRGHRGVVLRLPGPLPPPGARVVTGPEGAARRPVTQAAQRVCVYAPVRSLRRTGKCSVADPEAGAVDCGGAVVVVVDDVVVELVELVLPGSVVDVDDVELDEVDPPGLVVVDESGSVVVVVVGSHGSVSSGDWPSVSGSQSGNVVVVVVVVRSELSGSPLKLPGEWKSPWSSPATACCMYVRQISAGNEPPVTRRPRTLVMNRGSPFSSGSG